VLDLTLFSDQPIMHLIARLSDVAPDGQVARVTYGVLNLAHRDGHECPEPLEPGRPYRVTLALNDAGYRFGTAHRIRVAISTCYWPIVWPAPNSGRLSIVAGSSRLSLPVRAAAQPEEPVDFPPASGAALAPRKVLQPGEVHRTLAIDVGSGVERIEVLRDDGRALIEDIGVESGFRKILRYRIHPADPSSARAEAEYELIHRHSHGWDTTIRTRSAIGCTAEYYLLEADLEAFEGEERVFSRSWSERIPRDFT
jgi:hypothetical protein